MSRVDNVCPTEAIVTTEFLARVDERKCTACMRCVVVCDPFNAISVIPREAPLTLAIAPEEYDASRPKSFSMSYTRMETRLLFHNNFGPRSANIVPRSIYESDFIQKKFVCSLILTTAPTGITKEVDEIRLPKWLRQRSSAPS